MGRIIFKIQHRYINNIHFQQTCVQNSQVNLRCKDAVGFFTSVFRDIQTFQTKY